MWFVLDSIHLVLLRRLSPFLSSENFRSVEINGKDLLASDISAEKLSLTVGHHPPPG